MAVELSVVGDVRDMHPVEVLQRQQLVLSRVMGDGVAGTGVYISRL
jgi:hypothetical protein